MPKVRVHAFISGRVQGVFYRDNTKRAAEKLGLTGWVRNLPDGRVEVVAEGEKNDIDRLISYLHKGPLIAKVEKVDFNIKKFIGEYSEFSVRY